LVSFWGSIFEAIFDLVWLFGNTQRGQSFIAKVLHLIVMLALFVGLTALLLFGAVKLGVF